MMNPPPRAIEAGCDVVLMDGTSRTSAVDISYRVPNVRGNGTHLVTCGRVYHGISNDELRAFAEALAERYNAHAELVDVVRRLMRHMPADAGGASCGDDCARASDVLRRFDSR
jgi:hypothetical protein